MAAPPRKETISSRVLTELRQAILRGALQPGERINLDGLRDQFQSSISPLREALARLTGDGLVVFQDQRGFRVAPVSREEYLDLADLRAELEMKALRASIGSGGMEWESGVVRALHRLLRSPATDWIVAHDDFHRALISGAGRPLLQQAWARLADQDQRYRALTGTPDGTTWGGAEHEAIATAATRRDEAVACELLAAHLRHETTEVLDRLAV
jgi:GntR family carbon starvation induced transcriptional regulator